jgi:hypothetical protein
MSGKSALLRALRLVLFNKPEGSDFVFWGESDAEIEIEYDGYLIRRVKGKRNEYWLNESVFSAFGKNIPAEVADALGFSAIYVDERAYELNMDGPHDAPFLVSETDASKGKVLSALGEKLVGDLTRVDRAISKANRFLRDARPEKETLSAELVVLEKSLEWFSPLSDVSELLRGCRGLLADVEREDGAVSSLSAFRSSLGSMGCEIDLLAALLEVYEIAPVLGNVERAKALDTEIETFLGWLNGLTEVDVQVERLEHTYSLLEGAKDLSVTSMEGLVGEVEGLLPFKLDLEKLDGAIVQTESSLVGVESELRVVTEEYVRVFMRAKKCPLCLRPVAEHDLNEVLGELARYGRGNDKSYNSTVDR